MNEDCLKLTVYFGERKRVGKRFVADALLDLYGRHEIATNSCPSRLQMRRNVLVPVHRARSHGLQLRAGWSIRWRRFRAVAE